VGNPVTFGGVDFYTYDVGIHTDNVGGTIGGVELGGGITTFRNLDAFCVQLYAQYPGSTELTALTSSNAATMGAEFTTIDSYIYALETYNPYCGLVYPQMKADSETLNGGLPVAVRDTGGNPSGSLYVWENLDYDPENPGSEVPFGFTTDIDPPTGNYQPYVDSDATQIPGTPIQVKEYKESASYTEIVNNGGTMPAIHATWGRTLASLAGSNPTIAMANPSGSDVAQNEGDGNSDINNMMLMRIVLADVPGYDSTVLTGSFQNEYMSKDLSDGGANQWEFFTIPVEIPEPSTIVMLVVGALCLLGIRRRK
jgi:hypothetical protein